MIRIAALLALLLLLSSMGRVHAGTQNSCSDPYWANSLRCRLQPSKVPQPPVDPPDTLAELHPFARVDLTLDPSIRCVDGTRPIIYVDKALGPPSNRWIIAMTGGDNCAAGDLDNDGNYESGQDCLDWYLSQSGQQMGSAGEPAMSSVGDENGSGIMLADAQRNPLFARFNRVRIHKCGFDRHSGRATHANVSATLPPPSGATINYDLFNHGQKIVLEALATLVGQGAGQDGLSYTTWFNQGGVVAATQESLPSIADATQVLFVGHSSGGHGLYQNADRYAAWLRSLPDFSGDVRAIHDAHFMPAAENEAAFDPTQNPDPLTNNTLFDQRVAGNTNASGAYASEPYHDGVGSRLPRMYRAYLETPTSSEATILDASCVATHQSSGDAWKCRDRFHVRLHHESTPALTREDFADPNAEHTNWPIGFTVNWSEIRDYAYCMVTFGTPICRAVLTDQQYHVRLFIQAKHFLQGVHTLSELATGADNSGSLGSVFLWMPICNTHAGIYNNPEFFETSMAKDGSFLSYREFAEQFVAAPATGVVVGRVHQLDGAATECGPLLLRNGFD